MQVVSSDHSPVAAAFDVNVMLPYIPSVIDHKDEALIWPSGLKVRLMVEFGLNVGLNIK